MKPALLVIDVQQQFFGISPETAASLNKAIYGINQALTLFRDKSLPVVFVQHVEAADGLLPGTPDFELPEALDVRAGDPRVNKTYSNAFNKTDLESLLRGLGVDTLIVCGFCAEYCVLSTCRGA